MNGYEGGAAATLMIEKDTSGPGVASQDLTGLEIRWGLQMALRDKPLSNPDCGMTKAPFGRFFPIKTRRIPQENHTIDDTKPKEIIVERPAKASQDSLMEALAGTGAQDKKDWGLVVGFQREEDAAKMAVITETLFPTLSNIRNISAKYNADVIGLVCEGSDDLDFGTRESCVSCWWKWLQSSVCEAYMENVALAGMSVASRDPLTGEITTELIKPSIQELRAARELAIDSAKRGVQQLQAEWKQIAAEYEANDRIRKDISPYEHEYRKDLHMTRPQDRQIALARETVKQMQGGPSGGDNSALLEKVTDAVVMLAKGQAEIKNELAEIRKPLVRPEIPQMNLAETSEVPTVITNPSVIATTDSGLGPGESATETGLAPAAQAMEAAKNKRVKEK